MKKRQHFTTVPTFGMPEGHWSLPQRRTGKVPRAPDSREIWAWPMLPRNAKLREEAIRAEAKLDSVLRFTGAKEDTRGVNNTGPTRAGAIATPPSTDAAALLKSDDRGVPRPWPPRRQATWLDLGRAMVEAHHGWVESGRVEAVEDGMPSEDTWCRHTKCGTLNQPIMFVRRDKMTGEVKAFTSALWRCGRASPIPVRLGRLGYMTAALNRPGLAISFNLLDEAIRNGTSTRELCGGLPGVSLWTVTRTLKVYRDLFKATGLLPEPQIPSPPLPPETPTSATPIPARHLEKENLPRPPPVPSHNSKEFKNGPCLLGPARPRHPLATISMMGQSNYVASQARAPGPRSHLPKVPLPPKLPLQPPPATRKPLITLKLKPVYLISLDGPQLAADRARYDAKLARSDVRMQGMTDPRLYKL